MRDEVCYRQLVGAVGEIADQLVGDCQQLVDASQRISNTMTAVGLQDFRVSRCNWEIL